MAFEVEFSKRLDLFGAEIFAALNDKKVALEAQGKKLYNLSVGTPDFEPMPHIKQALCDAAMVSENWKYSLRDLPELLNTVCAYYKRRFDVDGITPDQIMSFNGSQDGMGHMGLALLNDGDVVLLPDPCYPVFITGVKLGGGLGTAITGWLLAFSNYDKALAVQPESCINMLKLMYLVIPFVLDAIITFILSRMKGEEANDKIRAEMKN